MTAITIAIGAILIVLGAVAWIVTEFSSWTALIPAIPGLLILVLGFLARNEKIHRHMIHAALAVSILGIAGGMPNSLKLGAVFAGVAERPGAVITSLLMVIVLLIYVALGLNSFISARRWKSKAAYQDKA